MTKELFVLDREIDRYCKRITSGIKSSKRRQEVIGEYAEYLEECVYNLKLQGINEQEAFWKSVDSLGDEDRIIQLLSSANNRFKLNGFCKSLILLFVVIIYFASYFIINNSSFRSYHTLFTQLIILIACIYVLYIICRFIRAIIIRFKTVKKLRSTSKSLSLKFATINNMYTSIFKRTESPELIIETDRKRYLINYWTTIWSKNTLRLMSNGIYSYSKNVGYMNLMTNPKGHLLTGGAVFCPPNIEYYRKFSNFHSDIAQIPKGAHLFPSINWDKYEAKNKENIRVLLLNPVPFHAILVENGVERKFYDGEKICGINIYSPVGFISFLKGENIKKNQH